MGSGDESRDALIASIQRRIERIDRVTTELSYEREVLTTTAKDLLALGVSDAGRAVPRVIDFSFADPATGDAVVGEAKRRRLRLKLASDEESTAKPTVRSAVQAILDAEPRAFTPTEIRNAIDPAVLDGRDEKKALGVIRTALWTLRKDGEATFYKGSKDQTISTRWYPLSPEGSTAGTEEPSVLSDPDPEGGENRDDHPERSALQGHGLDQRGRNRDDHPGAVLGT